MLEPVPEVPGVTFHIKTTARTGKTGEITLTASVEDETVWDAVVDKLHGFRVYTVEDLTMSIVSAVQENLKNTQDELTQHKVSAKQALEEAKQKLSMLKTECDHYKSQLALREPAPISSIEKLKLDSDDIYR